MFDWSSKEERSHHWRTAAAVASQQQNPYFLAQQATEVLDSDLLFPRGLFAFRVAQIRGIELSKSGIDLAPLTGAAGSGGGCFYNNLICEPMRTTYAASREGLYVRERDLLHKTWAGA
jgi:hypothetical protein